MSDIDVSARGPDWHATRLKHVGASEVSALFGIQPDYALSRYALWHVKAGHVPPPPVDSERIRWGLRLEPFIAEGAAERYGWIIRKGGYVTDPTTPQMGCTLDYIIAEPAEAELELGFSGPGAMELKNSDWMVHRRTWTDGEPPPHILLQLQHQLACTGYSWGVVVCLVGGNDLQAYRYAARPRLIADIRARVAAFWQSIRDGAEPDPDGSDGADHVLRALYHEMVDDIIDLNGDNELPTLCGELLARIEERKTAADAEADLKAQIMGKLGPHRKAWTQGYFVNMSVTPENPGRVAKPGEIVGKRKEVRRVMVKESAQ